MFYFKLLDMSLNVIFKSLDFIINKNNKNIKNGSHFCLFQCIINYTCCIFMFYFINHFYAHLKIK